MNSASSRRGNNRNYLPLIFAVVIVTLTALFTSCGYNKTLWDTTFKYNRAIVDIQTEVITVNIKSWTDYEDGDQIQLTLDDGTVMLVHSTNCTLIAD